MTLGDAALLVGAAVVGGALNSVAGGGSFFSFPALLFSGAGPIVANATSAVALWPGSVSAAVGYRKELRAERRALLWLGAPSLLGGVLGAVLLVRTPPSTFMALLPFLLLGATLLFTFGDRLKLGSRGGPGAPPRDRLWIAVIAQVPIALYGGYIGGGMGLMMLAAFSLAGGRDIHHMNALKSALAVLLNAAAIVTFVAAGTVDWLRAGVMVAGAVAGGFGGASLARRVPPRRVKQFVIAVGWALTAYFGWRAWLAPS
ncbi:MAG: sulfite exporter TauE/SafE family protein [Myxococcaceae bacterium]